MSLLETFDSYFCLSYILDSLKKSLLFSFVFVGESLWNYVDQVGLQCTEICLTPHTASQRRLHSNTLGKHQAEPRMKGVLLLAMGLPLKFPICGLPDTVKSTASF